jgi:hypothetical protein
MKLPGKMLAFELSRSTKDTSSQITLQPSYLANIGFFVLFVPFVFLVVG